MARYVGVHRRDAVDRRVRKDLRIESEARSRFNDASARNIWCPISSGMARMARYVGVYRRDAVDRRVRKDLRVESEARSRFNDASARNT
jgi:hypothetical protein